MRPDDWICPECGDLVFARKQRCRVCHTGKPQDPPDIAEASVSEPSSRALNRRAKRREAKERQRTDYDAVTRLAGHCADCNWPIHEVTLVDDGRTCSKSTTCSSNAKLQSCHDDGVAKLLPDIKPLLFPCDGAPVGDCAEAFPGRQVDRLLDELLRPSHSLNTAVTPSCHAPQPQPSGCWRLLSTSPSMVSASLDGGAAADPGVVPAFFVRFYGSAKETNKTFVSPAKLDTHGACASVSGPWPLREISSLPAAQK